MASQLSQQTVERIKEMPSRYPHQMSAILPALHLVMAEKGWVSKESCDEVAEMIDVPPIHVYEALTFYTYFPREPVGSYHIQVCHNIACNLRGAESVIDYLKDKHGVPEGEVSEDGLFRIDRVECLGACGGAPMMQVNDDYYEYLTFEKIDELIAGWRKEAGKA